MSDEYKIKINTSVQLTEIRQLEQIIQGVNMELGAMGARFATKLPSVITASIKAFGQEELAIQKLSAAIRHNGGMVSEVLPIMQELASNMQRITGYADDQILGMQGVASSMGVMPEQMESVIECAIGLSTALGMDLQTATRAASAAIQGKTELLTRYIPTLSMCTTEEEKLAKVQELSSNGMGQATDAMNTLEGKLRAAYVAWGGLQEVIGETFEPTVKTVAGLLKGVCETLTSMPIITKLLTAGLTSVAVGFAFTKVGGLANVAKMIMGVSLSLKSTTGAVHALNTAIKANPLGIIAGGATFAILAFDNLCDMMIKYESESEKANRLELERIESERKHRKQLAEDMRKATALLNEYSEEQKQASISAKELEGSINKLSSEIAELESKIGKTAGGETKNAEALIEKKRALITLEKQYLEAVQRRIDAEYAYSANDAVLYKYRVEQELNDARQKGVAHVIKFKETELQHADELTKKVEIQKRYYSDHVHLVKSEEDSLRIQKDAEKYAEMKIAQMRKETEVAKAIETSGRKLKEIEIDILKARKDGNVAEVARLEKEQRILQLSSEIFETKRRENMTLDELKEAEASARKSAEERYNLEKSVADEVERQNLAKNAQAQIEDILLTREIERLKAEGKLTEATALENERSVRRAMAGFDAFFKTMDKASANKARKEVEAALRDTNKFRSQTGVTTGTHAIGGGSEQRKPATVSAKNAPLYAEWQAMGGSSSGMTFDEFRKRQNAPKPSLNVGNAYNAIMSNASRIANLSGSAKVASEASSANVSKSVDDGLRQAEESKKKTSPKKKTEADNGVLKVLKKIEQNTARIVVKK